MDEAHLTSAKLSGRSHVSAPPKRPTFLNPRGMMVFVRVLRMCDQYYGGFKDEELNQTRSDLERKVVCDAARIRQ